MVRSALIRDTAKDILESFELCTKKDEKYLTTFFDSPVLNKLSREDRETFMKDVSKYVSRDFGFWSQHFEEKLNLIIEEASK